MSDWEIKQGDCLDVMRDFPDNHFSAIVTDPPYGLSFMNKGWDYAVPDARYWEECRRVSKPGAFLIAMGGTRTFHRLTCAIEDAGFEIRDCISWLYGSGFPKSHNHFGIEGYGTALKPAWEPCVVAMKPYEGTFKQNAEKWGQAGINVDGIRISYENEEPSAWFSEEYRKNTGFKLSESNRKITSSPSKGRWPANVILDEAAGKMLGEPSRFFYCAKTSSKERNEGLSGFPSIRGGVERMNNSNELKGTLGECERLTLTKNHHPTVKPLKLMEYLIKLVMPPKDGILLDPFCGSGSTIVAAHNLGIKAIGIEQSAEYAAIARERVSYYLKQYKQLDLFEDT